MSLRLWETVRDLTLNSDRTQTRLRGRLDYEKRSIPRSSYGPRDIEEIVVSGEERLRASDADFRSAHADAEPRQVR